MKHPERYRFGPFLLDVTEAILRRGDTVVPLTVKGFDLLVVLIRGAGRTITKTELMAALWPDTAVEEGNLTQTVFVLRKALGEDPAGITYIRTLPRPGVPIHRAGVR
jgi:DNA-binding winged helix-turn-helix (wHTH) protein